MKYAHSLEFSVRDYECDMQGVVNNGVYQNYLEHARHEFLQSRGISFLEMVDKKINLVVVRAELDYLDSLKSNDHFTVCSSIRQFSRLRFEFSQDIFRIPDQRHMLQAKIIGTSLNQRGRPFALNKLSQLYDN